METMELFCWNSSYSRSFRFEKGKYNRWNTAWEACFIFCTRHASSPIQFEDLFVFRKWTVLDHKNSSNGKNHSIKFRILYVIPGNRITILQSVNTTDAHLDFAAETSVTNSGREKTFPNAKNLADCSRYLKNYRNQTAKKLLKVLH